MSRDYSFLSIPKIIERHTRSQFHRSARSNGAEPNSTTIFPDPRCSNLNCPLGSVGGKLSGPEDGNCYHSGTSAFPLQRIKSIIMEIFSDVDSGVPRVTSRVFINHLEKASLCWAWRPSEKLGKA